MLGTNDLTILSVVKAGLLNIALEASSSLDAIGAMLRFQISFAHAAKVLFIAPLSAWTMIGEELPLLVLRRAL
jgi:hypothetical protein